MRINQSMLQNLIDNEGTTDGLNVPSAIGVLRLCLDLKEARERIKELEGRVERSFPV